jgi:hypothetical protein
MCDEHLQSATTGVLVLRLHRVEETFPILRRSTVSNVYMHAQKRILWTYFRMVGIICCALYPGPYLRTGQRGPGPGRHIKKIEIEIWYAGKKGCPRERNLREIYPENNIMFCLLSVFLCCFCLHITD